MSLNTTSRVEARMISHVSSDPLFEEQVGGWDSLPRVDLPRLPNPDWIAFLSGPLSLEDWALVRRVEAQEITVEEALDWREGRPDDAYGDQFPDEEAA